MSERLASFLTDLSDDPFKRYQFSKNREAFLDVVGLEGVDRRLLLDSDAAGIRQQFGVHLASASTTHMKPKAKRKTKATGKPAKAAKKTGKKKK
jgi:hypothetical protein